jgi:hypothetical protein
MRGKTAAHLSARALGVRAEEKTRVYNLIVTAE